MGYPTNRNKLFKQVRILKMDSPKRETPQTERAYIYMNMFISKVLYITYIILYMCIYIYIYIPI